MRKLITNARVVSPGVDLPGAALLIENGRIAAVIPGGEEIPSGIPASDAGGRLLMPGFIDIHSHGADGHDVCDDSLDSLHHIARRKLQEGVTTWLPTTLTQPREKLLSIAEKIAAFAKDSPTRFAGIHIEGPFINREKAGAQNPQFVRPPGLAEVEALHAVVPAKILSLAPELPGALDVIRGSRALGITCSAAHTSATAGQVSAACGEGLTHLTHYGNAMTPLHHREIGVVGAGMLDGRLMIELITDGIHLAPDMLRLVFKVIPIDRLMMITDSMAASWMGDGETSLGGLAVVVENEVARLKEGGALAGSALKANIGFKNLAEYTGLPLSELVRVSSWNQARSLGLDGLGRIEPGFHADFALFDPDFNVVKTFVGGEER